jgi:mitosis inhibitor protein kinase SWE1
LVGWDGSLKIADFGMATKWPAAPNIEGEGDREYIAPEILRGQYDKPADIFSFGIIMFEIAGNVVLPDNGAAWQRLRSGDTSDVPSLSWTSDGSAISRDTNGEPLQVSPPLVQLPEDCDMDVKPKTRPLPLTRDGELPHPPDFMLNYRHEQAIDAVIRWMIETEPQSRPIASQLLQTAGVRFVSGRRRAGATVYEGNWGPADEVLAEDAEMVDV